MATDDSLHINKKKLTSKLSLVSNANFGHYSNGKPAVSLD